MFYYFYRFLLSSCVCQLLIMFMMMMIVMRRICKQCEIVVGCRCAVDSPGASKYHERGTERSECGGRWNSEHRVCGEWLAGASGDVVTLRRTIATTTTSPAQWLDFVCLHQTTHVDHTHVVLFHAAPVVVDSRCPFGSTWNQSSVWVQFLQPNPTNGWPNPTHRKVQTLDPQTNPTHNP